MSSLADRLKEIADTISNDAELARFAKVSRSAVSQWKKGDVRALKALTAVNIQERTGYSVRWLVLGIGPKKVSGKVDSALRPDGQTRLNSKDEQKLLVVLRAFLDADDDGKNEILEAVRAVSEDAGGQPKRPQRRGAGAGN